MTEVSKLGANSKVASVPCSLRASSVQNCSLY